MDIRFNHLHFLDAEADYPSASLVLLGCPFDGTASHLPGSRFAPNAIREASQAIESYSHDLNTELSELRICDLGDLELPFGNTPRALDLIEKAISQVLRDGKIPVILGGEHLISLPILRAFNRYYPDLIVIHLDAHADLRDEYLGEKLSHATVMRRVVELIGADRLLQLGIRSVTREEMSFACQIGCQYHLKETKDLTSIGERIKGKNIYLSLDLDILDPSVLPGTGTPEPGGLSFNQLREILSFLKAGKVVGLDMVELLPIYSTSQVSNIVAAKLLRELLLLHFAR